MPYNDVIIDADVDSLIPIEYYPEIFKGAINNSVVLSLGRRLRDMAAGVNTLPIEDVLPLAYFVAAGGKKQTGTMEWKDKTITAEEIAVIVPIHESTLEDSRIDFWAEILPRVGEAFGTVIDSAVLFGTNAPASWPTDISAAAIAAGNGVEYAAAMTWALLAGTGGLIEAVELDGYFPNGYVASKPTRALLRTMVDANNNTIFKPGVTGANVDIQAPTSYYLDGQPVMFPGNGVFANVTASDEMIFCGDWTQLVYSMRRDMTVKLLTEAVITDAEGVIQHNLAQQDMVALRIKMRLGWQVPNPVNLDQATEANRYPFSVLIDAIP